MSSKRTLGNEVSVDVQPVEQESEFEVVEETPELRPSVEQEIQSTIDYADEEELEGRLFGQTLEAEERMQAREWEIERTELRYDRRPGSDREARSRRVAKTVSIERRREFEKRAASVDPWADPDRDDPREMLSREELGLVNEEAARMEQKLNGWSRAAISRRLAQRLVDGASPMEAIIGVFEELQTAEGQMIPIAAVDEVPRREVSIRGEVVQLWEPSHPSISQVGLLEDDSGRIKFTTWRKSKQPLVDEGEEVIFRSVAKNWYQGQCSIALTGWSLVWSQEKVRSQSV